MMRLSAKCVGLVIGFLTSGVLGCGDGVHVGELGAGNGGNGGDGGSAGSGLGGPGEICTCLEGCGTCPSADSVPIPDYDFSIDRTEVTNAQYALFVAAEVAPQATWDDPGYCDWNDTFVPKNGWPAAAGREEHPVVWVDRCDALAFCEWAGKHLCGKIGEGSEGEVEDYNSPTKSEWFNTCASATSQTSIFPYGWPSEPTTCNGAEYGAGDSLPVGSLPDCRGSTAPYDEVLDLSGNVAEWADRVSSGIVTARGGSYLGDWGALVCSAADLVFDATDQDARGDLGFRCCAD
jgi:formylglycine-generating enzyme